MISSMRLLASSILPQASSAHTPHLLGAVVVPTARRLFKTGTIAMGHGSHDSDNKPDILQKEKERNLTGQTPEIIPGAPGFNPALASDSEAAIRAERAPSMPMEELQAHSVKMMQHLQEGGEHPGVPDEVVNPSEKSQSIRDNLEEGKRKGEHAIDPTE